MNCVNCDEKLTIYAVSVVETAFFGYFCIVTTVWVFRYRKEGSASCGRGFPQLHQNLDLPARTLNKEELK